ncbi:thiosulfate sulfurtransferase GlpE [Halomonas sp. McH1-25]|uniref:thiosulfate sulfurtransferase GlpE n=1 Tax=unclassified Halomonas TaxID=2609666 RepID=UPI001EF4FD29|nr:MULTISPECIES: thiosulfate sulfurtransferase GlpE [unclassified Halomonas]MCG7600641.1 thiosulfate sulfurtransferase GlpE [Halomonas sp. McH1-25]MCP1341219.1 thiosulfate sulfurtransferase GlpE [Halomonas sp. FL8]MCP1362903.1 thiosulfate sulfurtransferase GlpE [Halomonas sp. BBD45]MCP1365797.1 thiosulfate sulfurtransferase GlpE [Halomonas sp. BBD48]
MTQAFEHLDPVTLKAWLDEAKPLTLVDIRDPLSYARGHIPGSRHLDNATVGTLLDESPRDRAMVVVCYHGHSSQQAATWLAGQGFSHVYSLDGGFTDWEHRHPQRVMRQS